MTAAEKVIDLDYFAGGGGASLGFYMATGKHPDVAVNHDPKAIAMHKANHPGTLHVCQDVWSVPPRWLAKGRKVAWFHASPDCTHHSKAKGGPPTRDEKRRDLAWVIVKVARELLPNCISLENVEEFLSWGPCDSKGVPIKSQAGASFRAFVRSLRALGYKVEWRELRACDYGAPTIRKRLFLIARRDGRPIVWPKPTHGDPKSPAVKSGKLLPYRTAAECIDWTHPCPSIFERARPMAEATLRRIAEGIERYVIRAAEPFIVTYYGAKKPGDFRGCGMGDLLGTQTTENRHGLVTPCIVGCGGRAAQIPPRSPEVPFQTVTAKADACLVTPFLAGAGGPVYAGKPVPADRPMNTVMVENHTGVIAPVLVTNTSGHAPSAPDAPVPTLTTGGQQMLVAPGLIQTGYGERQGQAPRALDIEAPLGTVVACGQKHGLVAVHMQRDFGNSVGHSADGPCGTVTAGGGGKSGLVTSNLVKLRGTCKGGQPTDAPAPTVTSGGTHVGEVRACLMKFYGEGGQHSHPAEPMHTIPTKDRMAVVEARPAGGHAAEVRALLRWHRQGKLAKAWGWRMDDLDGLAADAFAGEVVLGGEVYSIADIGMRMLQPRELYRAQGFPDSYVIGDDPAQGLTLTKAEQVRMCGNSVCPPVLAALVAANYTEDFATDLGRRAQALPLLAGEGAS